MKLILNDHIEHLGERGQTVDVKPGYANNYLLPKGLAYPDTPGNRKRFEQEQTKWEEMDLKRQSAAQQLAAELDGTSLAFERRAGENDVLFGSVTAADIGSALAERGFEIDRRRIVLDQPIKALGQTDIVVRVHRDIDVTIPVSVVRPGEDPDAVAPEFVAEGVLETPEDAAEAEAASIGGDVDAATAVSDEPDAPEAEPVTE